MPRLVKTCLLSLSIYLTAVGLSAQAMVGGTHSGGGGDYVMDTPPTDQDVRTAIAQAQVLAPFVLAHLESVAVEARAIGSAKVFGSKPSGDLSLNKLTYDRLFPWPSPDEDVFGRWKRLRVVASDHDCHDEFAVEKAASAYPYESDQICMSLPLIRANANKANLLRRVTALLIHEVSHKMGIGTRADNHQDSVDLENVVIAGIPADPFGFLALRIQDLENVTRVPDGSLARDLKFAQDELATGRDWDSICFALGRISIAGSALGLNHNHTDGFSMVLVRAIFQAEEEAFQKRSALLSAYCKASTADTNNEGIRPGAINRGGDAVLSMTRGILRKPKYHDAPTLRLELQDARKSLEQIYAAAHQAGQDIRTSVMTPDPKSEAAN